MSKRDLNIWEELPPLDNGFVPAKPRRWRFIGKSRGVDCDFPVELIMAHPTLPDLYMALAVFNDNLHYCCRDWVRIGKDIVPYE